MTCENITMAQFATNLPLYAAGSFMKPSVAKPVVDATVLKGAWDFTSTFTASSGANPFGTDAANGGGGLQTNDPCGVNLFEAVGKQSDSNWSPAKAQTK
jgi:uncharacterized protein (TIGR03435 family)